MKGDTLAPKMEGGALVLEILAKDPSALEVWRVEAQRAKAAQTPSEGMEGVGGVNDSLSPSPPSFESQGRGAERISSKCDCSPFLPLGLPLLSRVQDLHA